MTTAFAAEGVAGRARRQRVRGVALALTIMLADCLVPALPEAISPPRAAQAHAASAAGDGAHLESLRRDVAALQRTNALAWSLGGLALLLIGGIAAMGTRRALRTQARTLAAQLDALEHRHDGELSALRLELSRDLSRELGSELQREVDSALARMRADATAALALGARAAPAMAGSAGSAAREDSPFATDARVVLSAPIVASVAHADRDVELGLVYDPSSLVIVEEPGTSPAEADARWQSLTGAPLTQIELQPVPPAEPASALRGNLTMDHEAHDPAVIPAHAIQGGGLPGANATTAAAVPERNAALRARLAGLELQDDLRRRLNAQPELLRGLVEEALAIVLQATHTRTPRDWWLLVLDAWRRDNMQEALARTESMLAAATSEADRGRAHDTRRLVRDRIERPGATAAPIHAITATAASALPAPEPPNARAPAVMLREAVRLRREDREPEAARALLEELLRELDPADDAAQAQLWRRTLINLALVEASAGGDGARAIALYDRALQSTQGTADAALTSAEATTTAQALFNRAVLRYERAGDVAGANDDYRRIVARFGSRSEPDILLTVAHALSNQAWLLATVQHDVATAIARYLELDRRFGERRDRGTALLAASALFTAAVLSARELRADASALALYRRLVNRHELTTDRAFVVLVAKSLFNMGALLGTRPEAQAQAIDACSALIERCAGSDDPQLAEWAAGGLVNKAGLLLRAGDTAGAITAYDALLQLAPTAASLRHEQIVARGLANLAYLHANRLQDTELALRAFTRLLARFGQRDESELAEQCARALLGVGVLQATRRQDHAAAVTAYQALDSRYGQRAGAQFALVVAKGLFNLAALQLRQLRDLPAALATLHRLVARFLDDRQPEVEVRVASGLLTRARVLERLDDSAAARASCRQLITRYGNHVDPRVQSYVAAAQSLLGAPASHGASSAAPGDPGATAESAGEGGDDATAADGLVVPDGLAAADGSVAAAAAPVRSPRNEGSHAS